jgi:hypothetical protein
VTEASKIDFQMAESLAKPWFEIAFLPRRRLAHSELNPGDIW